MIDAIQDFFTDHPTASTLLSVAAVLCIVFGIGAPVTMDVIDDLQTQIDVNEVGIADNFAAIGINVDDIDELEKWYEGFYGEDGTWFTFVKLVTDALTEAGEDITALNTRIADVEDWLDDFYNTDATTLGEWQQFLLGLNARINTLINTATAGWHTSISANTANITGLQGWAELIDDWATDNSGSNWDDYPEYTEE